MGSLAGQRRPKTIGVAAGLVIGTTFAWVLGLGVSFLAVFTTNAASGNQQRVRDTLGHARPELVSETGPVTADYLPQLEPLDPDRRVAYDRLGDLAPTPHVGRGAPSGPGMFDDLGWANRASWGFARSVVVVVGSWW